MARIGFLEKPVIAGIKKKVLKNGLTVFLEEMPERKKVVFLVAVGVGSRDEPGEIKGLNRLIAGHGIGHFTEHIQFKSNRFRTADEITEDIEDGGAIIVAGTDFDCTNFYVRGYSRYLSKNIRILYEIISNFEYKEEEVEAERQEVITEIKDAIDSPKDSYIDHLFLPHLFRRTVFEKPVLGTQKSVKHITREDLAAFKRKFYVPENMIIFVCGHFDEEKVLRAIGKTFSRFKKPLPERDLPEINLKNRRREFFKKRKGLKLVYLALGYKVAGFDHPDSVKLMLLDYILSGGKSSRLYRELCKERGIGYNEVESDYDDYGGIGAFYIQVGGFDPKRFKEARRVILKEIDDLKTNLVSKREFLRAKNLFIAANDDNLEDLEFRTEWLADSYFRKSVFDPRNLKKCISKISREALRRTAQKYFTDGYTLTALVPENFKI